MQLLSLNNISLKYGDKPLLKNINLMISNKERVCLVGRNGAGKSSLLNIIQQNIEPDSGEIVYKDNLRIGFLTQELPEKTVLTSKEIVTNGLGEIGHLLVEYERLSVCHSHEKAINEQRLHSVQKEIDNKNGWIHYQKVNKILSRLAINPTDDFDTLSGGQKKKVMLAKAIVSEPDLLILDEPTNHLDIPSILWLETFLCSLEVALLFVTHDRFLLDSVATKIIELDRNELYVYPSGYDSFLKLRNKRWQDEELKVREFNKKLAKEEAWIRQGIKARRTRNEGRVRALKKLRLQKKDQISIQSKPSLTTNEAEMSGKTVIEAENLTLELPNKKPLISNFSVTIQRGDKIGIIGKNGIGKTMLIEGLLGNLKPISGKIITGTKLSIAYFDQMRDVLKTNQSLLSTISEGRDFVTINGSEKHVSSYLQDFLFTPDKFRIPVGSLSGGEKNRLLLALLFSRPANLLVLDEPTNDLDIETLELLEENLQSFKGTILVVSHDRYFLDNIVTHTLYLDNNTIDFCIGGYSDWKAREDLKEKNYKKRNKNNSSSLKKKSGQRKLTYNEENRLRSMPEEVTILENKIHRIHKMLNEENVYKEDPMRAKKAEQELQVMENSLKTLFEEWESLETKKSMFLKTN